MSALVMAGRMIAVAPTATRNPQALQLDGLMFFGFLSAFFTLAFYFSRHCSRSCMVAFAISLASTAVYGFLQGAWPLGAIQIAWCAITLWQLLKPGSGRAWSRPRRWRVVQATPERISRMFGPL
jgi:hypothetical protein